MASGNWLGWYGDTPAHMSAWCKQELGWLSPTSFIENSTSIEIPDVNSEPFAIRIWEDDFHWNRYFLIENRQKIGFDSDLMGSGLVIYHIDENRSYGSGYWSGGPVNNDAVHKMIDIEEADGLDQLDLGENRLHSLLNEYGYSLSLNALDALKQRAETMMRTQISNLPNGKYSAEDWLDNDGISDVPLKIALDLTIDNDQMVLDFSHSSKACSGPVNISASLVIN